MAKGKKSYKQKKKNLSRMKTLRVRRRRGPRVYRTLGGFPDSVQVKLRYSSFITLDPNPANPAQHLFRCISVRDPDFTTGVIGDHQPMYYDQWAGIYTKYTVKGSRCMMSWLAGAETNQNAIPGLWGIYTTTSQQGVDVFNDTTGILEANNTTNMRICGNLNTGLTNPSKQSRVKAYFSTRDFFGIRDPTDGSAYSAETTSGTTGNPSQEAYFACYLADINGNNPGEQQFYVEIDYIVEFRDRRPIDQS